MKKRDDAVLVFALAMMLVTALAARVPAMMASSTPAVQPIVTQLNGLIDIQGERVMININAADEALLQSLTGIGPVLSRRIVEYRAQNGPFTSIEQLKNISGIGDGLLGQIANQVCLE